MPSPELYNTERDQGLGHAVKTQPCVVGQSQKGACGESELPEAYMKGRWRYGPAFSLWGSPYAQSLQLWLTLTWVTSGRRVFWGYFLSTPMHHVMARAPAIWYVPQSVLSVKVILTLYFSFIPHRHWYFILHNVKFLSLSDLEFSVFLNLSSRFELLQPGFCRYFHLIYKQGSDNNSNLFET